MVSNDLQFKYTLVASENDESASLGETKTISLTHAKRQFSSQFFYHWQLGELNIQPGDDEFTYFFEVWDNDGVNGSKSARTVTRTYAAPSIEELEEKARRERMKKSRTSFSKPLMMLRKLQEDLDKLREDMLNKKELGWQEKKKLEEVLKQQQEVGKTSSGSTKAEPTERQTRIRVQSNKAKKSRKNNNNFKNCSTN